MKLAVVPAAAVTAVGWVWMVGATLAALTVRAAPLLVMLPMEFVIVTE